MSHNIKAVEVDGIDHLTTVQYSVGIHVDTKKQKTSA